MFVVRSHVQKFIGINVEICLPMSQTYNDFNIYAQVVLFGTHRFRRISTHLTSYDFLSHFLEFKLNTSIL